MLRAYQQLLKLAGRNPEAAFPEGIWQFYVDYALRDDTARHTCETHGFATALRRQAIRLSEIDRLTAWVMTAVTCLHQYPRYLENEWRERVYTHALWQIAQNDDHADLYREWEAIRPFQNSSPPAPNEDFPAHRQRLFKQFLQPHLRALTDNQLYLWQTAVNQAEANQLPAYKQQMSILAFLQPGSYGEIRTPIPPAQAWIGLIYHGRYYLLPITDTGGRQPINVADVRRQITSILSAEPATGAATSLQAMAKVKRVEIPALRRTFMPTLRQELDLLKMAPIWINGDMRPHNLPLAQIRQAERGIGDHPLTIFTTEKTAVFDLSHIFFDGAWGVALAEILTNEAIRWAEWLAQSTPAVPNGERPFHFTLAFQPTDHTNIAKAAHVAAETSAECSTVNLAAIRSLRHRFKQYDILRQLTVNDLMLLYRAIHAIAYRPSPAIVAELKRLAQRPETKGAANSALTAVQTVYTSNPAILIPVDAGRRSPKDRVSPMTFEVPLTNLDLVNRHQQTLAALASYERSARNRQVAYDHFDEHQRSYLTVLAGLGQVLSSAKARARLGDSFSMENIKLLAHLPTVVQRLLDKIPNQFDEINDAIKGREVFSNVGAVVPGSSLTRFITAKDDNEKKELAWGVLTDANDVVHISLRDFRPHVAQLTAVNQEALATRITTDILTSYADGLNAFVQDLLRILDAAQAVANPRNAAVSTTIHLNLPAFAQQAHHRYGCWMPGVAMLVTAVITVIWFFGFRQPERNSLFANTNQDAVVETAVISNTTRQLITPPPTPTPTTQPTASPLPTNTRQPTNQPTNAPTNAPTEIPPPTAVSIRIRPQDEMPMVLIGSTTFMMGASPTDAAAEPDERPSHAVMLDAYTIDQYEVSVAQYVAFLNDIGGYLNACNGFSCLITQAETRDSHVVGIINGGFVAETGFEQHPINNVSWHGATAYCASVGARLPTEAEWELAARGEDGRIYPWGSEPPDASHAVWGTDSFAALQPVNALAAGISPFQLYNMAGSVWEWVADGYDTFYYKYSPSENPTGPETDNVTPRILRGGGFTSAAADIRATNRHLFSATEFRDNVAIGFRCAQGAP